MFLRKVVKLVGRAGAGVTIGGGQSGLQHNTDSMNNKIKNNNKGNSDNKDQIQIMETDNSNNNNNSNNNGNMNKVNRYGHGLSSKREESLNDDSKDNSNKNSNENGKMKMGGFDPSQFVSSNEELKKVEQLGTITINELSEYNCDANRQCISLFGIIYDVTDAKDKYGPNGAYKSFAGHDITFMLATEKLQDKWLDKFVQFTQEQRETAQSWVAWYDAKYPKCGKLDIWDSDASQWPQLTPKEQTEIDQECIIM